MPTTPRILLQLIWNHPANRTRRLRTLAATASWQAYKRVSDRPRTMRIFGDLRFRAYPSSTAPGRLIYYGGLPDYNEMLFIQRYVRPGDQVVDGGANEGSYTLLMARLVGAGGSVHAFEPLPVAAERLTENCSLNEFHWIVLHRKALADERGETAFTVGRMDAGNRIARLEDTTVDKVRVPTVVLDDVVEDRCTFIKLDLEGAEPLALRGAARSIARSRPPVFQLEFRAHFLRRFGSSPGQLVAWMDERGYETMLYDADANRLGTVTVEAAVEAGDVFFVSRDRADWVRARLAG